MFADEFDGFVDAVSLLHKLPQRNDDTGIGGLLKQAVKMRCITRFIVVAQKEPSLRIDGAGQTPTAPQRERHTGGDYTRHGRAPTLPLPL